MGKIYVSERGSCRLLVDKIERSAPFLFSERLIVMQKLSVYEESIKAISWKHLVFVLPFHNNPILSMFTFSLFLFSLHCCKLIMERTSWIFCFLHCEIMSCNFHRQLCIYNQTSMVDNCHFILDRYLVNFKHDILSCEWLISWFRNNWYC